MKRALILFVILAAFGLLGAALNESDVAIRAIALDAAVAHHSSLMVQEYRVDPVVTANRFERYLRSGYGGK